MNIDIVSLTDHRIDIKFADYIFTALDSTEYPVRKVTDYSDLMIVTNGMIDGAKPEVLQRMKEIPSIYLIDDHTCWIPDLKEYPKCKIYSQFTEHPIDKITPMTYFQVSKLALFDERFDSLLYRKKAYVKGYWGQYKPERYEEYKKYCTPGTYVIGRRYPEELSNEWKMLPFTKDLNELNSTISTFSHTPIFGDKFHNGVNLPYRIYEALMNGVIPEISHELLGNQKINIVKILDYLYGRSDKYAYRNDLDNLRMEIVEELCDMIRTHPMFELIPLELYPTSNDNNFDSVTKVLAERATIYGSYGQGVTCRAVMMDALNIKHIECNGVNLPEEVRVVFSDILLKLMRAASDPTHKDSWLDLAGYSKIINQYVEEGAFDVFNS